MAGESQTGAPPIVENFAVRGGEFVDKTIKDRTDQGGTGRGAADKLTMIGKDDPTAAITALAEGSLGEKREIDPHLLAGAATELATTGIEKKLPSQRIADFVDPAGHPLVKKME